MANTELNISLTGPIKNYVEAKVESGAYGNPLEYVSDLILNDHDRQLNLLEDRIEAAVKGESIEIPHEVLEQGHLVDFLEAHLAKTR